MSDHKGFFLYLDQYKPIQKLTKEQKGELLEAMFAFNSGEDFEFSDPLVEMAFGFFEQTFERDQQRYADKCAKMRANAAKKQVKAEGSNCNQKQPDASESTQQQEQKQEQKQEKKEEEYINPELAEFVGTFQAYAIQLHGNTAPKITPSSTRQSEDCVDKLMRIDGFALADIRAAMRWAVKDTFWSPNARSLAQLRNKGKNGLTKFQSIYAAWKRETGGGDDDVPIGDMAALRAEAIRKYGPGAG